MKSLTNITIALIVAIVVCIFTACSSEPSVTYKKVVVGPTDTVWSLIKDNNDESIDIQYMLFEYKQHGGSNYIRAGEKIEIPVVVK